MRWWAVALRPLTLGTYLNEWHFDNSCLLFLLLVRLQPPLLLAKVKCYQNTAKLNEFSFSLAFLFAQLEATPNWETKAKRSGAQDGVTSALSTPVDCPVWRIIPIDMPCVPVHLPFAPPTLPQIVQLKGFAGNTISWARFMSFGMKND